jgi:hypothetical protein
MHIFIPTRGRVRRQVTWQHLPPSVRARTRLLVDDDEAAAHVKEGYPVTVMPIGLRGIGAVRQMACDYATKLGDGRVLMMDDDLRFYTRRHDDPRLLEKASEASLETMFAAIEQELCCHALVGIASREGANRCVEPLIENTRILRLLAYRADIMTEEGIRFDRLPVMEDFDVALQLLERGHPNLVLNLWAHNQEGSGTTGGCSSYRTREIQADAARLLAEHHPRVVRVVEKVTKRAWGGGKRTDVVIAWKKAFRSKME